MNNINTSDKENSLLEYTEEFKQMENKSLDFMFKDYSSLKSEFDETNEEDL